MPGPFQISFQGQPISTTNQPQITQLKSGQDFTFPVGWFLVKVPPQSALQIYDANSGMWINFDGGYSNSPIPINSDGTNFRVKNLSGTIQGATITNAGSSYASSTTVTFAAPAAGETATANAIIGGSLTFSIPAGSTGGTGYVKPYLLIPPPQLCGGTPGFCLPAAVSLGISGSNVINAETVGFGGAGYVTAPGNATRTITPAQFAANPSQYQNSNSMIIIDPAGSGATIQATIAGAGTLTGIVMVKSGSGYDGTHIPAVTITDPTNAGSNAAATALGNFALTSVTIGSTNTGYTASVLGITSLGAATAAQIYSNNGQTCQPRAGSFTCTQSGGALQAAIIEDAGIGFQTVPLAKQVGNATADGSVNATFTAVVGGVTNTLYYWQIA